MSKTQTRVKTLRKTLRQKIHHAEILLKCSNPNHINDYSDCVLLKDKVFSSFKLVLSIYVKQVYENKDVNSIDSCCVSASAIVKDGEINKFRKQLKELNYSIGGKNKKQKVNHVKLLVSQDW